MSEIEDRIPPWSELDEKGLLGCMLLAEDAIDEAIDTFPPGADGFYDLRHRSIYKAILWLHSDGAPIDPFTVFRRVKDLNPKNEFDGGLAYISSLPEFTASAANLEYYLNGCLDAWRRRKLISVCTELAGAARVPGPQNGELLERAERDILAIGSALESSRGVADLQKLQIRLVDRYEAAQKGGKSGLMTGFPDLDNITGGMQPQDMIVVMGQQSAGKTTLALNIACNVAFAGTTVGILSLETSAEKVLHRIYCSIAEVNGARFLRGHQVLEWEMKAMMLAMDKVQKNRDKFLIDDSGGLSAERMMAKARRLRQKGAGLLIIDYMQLLHAEGTEYERVTSISRAIKDCAKEGDWPVIAISSLNREGSTGEGKPKIRNARGSGQIDYDGNQFWLLSTDDPGNSRRVVSVQVAKNKDGETGALELLLFAPQFGFKSVVKEVRQQDGEA